MHDDEAPQCEDAGHQTIGDGRGYTKAKPQPIPHARRLALMTMASELVQQMATKTSPHERRFFLDSIDRMLNAEQFQR